MPKLSVIIPFVNEWPLICTTIRSVGEALTRTGIEFDVIAVDNWCEEVKKQGRTPDRGHTLVESLSKKIPWLKVIRYPDKLSHWNAKNYAGEFSNAEFLLFMDAHCIMPNDTVDKMFRYYVRKWPELKGSLHLPVTYHILEEKRLIYNMRWRPEFHDLDYTFASALDSQAAPYEVPCMSCCGLMIHREFLDMMGWWPKSLGIYGGGEHWLNYTMAVMGLKKWIWPGRPLYHHGDERGYRWNAEDYERNRMIAAFLFGGGTFAYRHATKRNPKQFPNRRVLQRIHTAVVNNADLNDHRDRIKLQQQVDIYEFIDKWKGGGLE